MSLETINRVLVIRLSSFGDILLTTPFVRSLKHNKPSVEIDYLSTPQYADLLKYNPNISNVYHYNKSGSNSELLAVLKKNNYELVIDLHSNLRSRILTAKIHVPTVRYRKPSIKKYLLVNFKKNLLKDAKSIPERYAEVLPEITLDEAGPELYLPDQIDLKVDEKLIGFCPGSKHFTKMWPAEYFIELGNLLLSKGFKVDLLGGRDDRHICSKIEKKIPGVLNKCSDDDLFQTAAEMKRCKLVVCNDSGLMHLATAVGVPVTAIFGSTVREFGFFPYKSKSLVLENNSISCRPCSHIGRASCPEEHFNCMLEVTPHIVSDNIQKYMINND